ncbi:serine/threonine protein kinase [Glycomyces tritici]|uniref:non-specific serine/threonine protein kinase n=1 Tax=Glycomyces tritici TaxID=2665176 RepID=A0ABT7YI85_9ACTN|nr:serine/threonine protein kinase [Glycomyces tritici]MDN3238313.1 serine/threonine protein kinase [Glycomyces tritici]
MDSGTLIAGRYRLDRVIASGGMGAVWRAEDERLDRTVAVKVLHAGLDGSQRPRDRFEREAKTLASLKGPGCVEVYDFGEEPDGDRTVVYLVMELVDGVSLAELLHREERLDPARTMRIVAEAAEALAAAHRRGIVHRDIKPGNLLIDADDRVKVVDFGISLFANRSRLTPSDQVLGTAPYVSPEQLRDKGVTGASDLYSLGAVAYECLTGTPPFDAADPAAVIHGHLYSEPPALPADVPVEVAVVVSRSLSKSPEERWESGDVLAAAARAATTGRHPAVTPPAFASAPADANAAEARTPDVPLQAAQPPFMPPVTPPSQPAAVEPPAEDPRRRRRLVLIGLAAVLALTVIAVVALNPFSGDGKVADGEDDTSPTLSASTSASGSAAAQEPSSSASASPAESEAPTEEEPEDDGGGSEPEGNTGGGNEDEDEPLKEGGGPVPDVRGGTTFDARDQLNGEGFANVVAQVGYYYIVPEPEHCTVIDQSPAAGETADYSGQITVYFHERTAEGTSCLL